METYLPVPAASKTLAWFSAGLPDENSSGHGRDSSTDLLQIDETGGDMVNCRPSSLAMLLAYIVRKFSSRPQAIRPGFHLTILSLLGCGLC